MLKITEGVEIPLEELRFRFSRSGGPGGQHVNRVETRVELLFDVRRSAHLSDSQRARILEGLKGYIDNEGVLHLFSRATRSQWQNREEVIERFRELLAAALRPRRRRRPTRPSRGARERRLAAKRRRSERKRQRRKPEMEE
ncbi:MAG: alternative ribosome rescue aminoacyl-tRNA hydrolase ArfB [Candidatus Bipolaricaulia bacterium]